MAQETRIAVVTGSGKKRVGQAIARRLAEHGYTLAIHYRSSADDAQQLVSEFTAKGIKSAAFKADLASESEVRRFSADVFKAFGRVDVLVNAAAIWERKRLEEVTADDVRRHFDANTLGTFLCCQQFGLRMTSQPEGGVIINIGDWAEVRPYLDYSAYFPSKGGVSTLTRSFAVELAHRNPRVRVNAILPGPVMLPADLPAAERAASIDGTLVKCEGSPEHVAAAALALIENDFITGACLPVDGGRTLA